MSDFRARSNAELLDAAFEIYRRHFSIFLAVGVIAALPMAIMQYSWLSVVSAAPHGGLPIPTDPVAGASAASLTSLVMYQVMMLVAYLVMLVVTPFTDGITVVAAARSYLGETVELGDAVRVVFARPMAVLLAYWARFFLIMVVGMGAALIGAIAVAIGAAISRILGAILLVLLLVAVSTVALVIWKRYFAVIPVLLVEEKRVADSMSRSRILADGNGARIVLLIGGVIVVALIVGMMLGGIAAALLSGVVGALLYLFCTALVNQFAGVVLTLLYFDLRIRKEGYDIELLASTLDGAPTALASDTPPSVPATA